MNNVSIRHNHQIINCFNLLEKASVLLINQRIRPIIATTAHAAKINIPKSFVIKAKVNNG
jgi:hypothetical protein